MQLKINGKLDIHTNGIKLPVNSISTTDVFTRLNLFMIDPFSFTRDIKLNKLNNLEDFK